MSIPNTQKERLVNAFLRGESVTDLSAFFAVHRVSIEDVLRESIMGLAALNKTLYKQLHPVVIAQGPDVIGSMGAGGDFAVKITETEEALPHE